MVYILAASSDHRATDVLRSEQQSKYKDKVYAIPGLSLNPYAKNPKKIMQNLHSKDLKDIVVWYDVLNKSICRHKSNNYRPLSVSDLINVLKALVYCQRDRTPDVFDSLQESEKSKSIQVFSFVKDYISIRKQNNPDLFNQLEALHQILEIELKNIGLTPRKESDLSSRTETTW